MTNWSINVRLEPSGDLVWSGADSGPHLKSSFGASDYEWWRTVKAADVPALAAALGGSSADVLDLVRRRFASDVELAEFAQQHGIETTFSSWTTTDWSR